MIHKALIHQKHYKEVLSINEWIGIFISGFYTNFLHWKDWIPKKFLQYVQMRIFLENILHNPGDYVIESIDLAQRLGDYAHKVKHFNGGNLSPIYFSLISFFNICKKDWESMPIWAVYFLLLLFLIFINWIPSLTQQLRNNKKAIRAKMTKYLFRLKVPAKYPYLKLFRDIPLFWNSIF